MAQKTELLNRRELQSLKDKGCVIIRQKNFSIATPALGSWSGYEVTYEEPKKVYSFDKFAFNFGLTVIISTLFAFFCLLRMYCTDPYLHTHNITVLYENKNIIVWQDKNTKKTWETLKLSDYKEMFQRITKS